MEPQEVVSCRIRVRASASETGPPTLTKVHDHPKTTTDIRKQWVKGICTAVEFEKDYQKIRPLDFVLGLDGSVEHVSSALPEKNVLSSDTDYPTVYASPYQIPPKTIEDLNDKEKVRRAVLFALGGLIYEIHSGKEPFERLDDNEVQRRYTNAEFPDVRALEQWPLILSCWSVEFAGELSKFFCKRSNSKRLYASIVPNPT